MRASGSARRSASPSCSVATQSADAPEPRAAAAQSLGAVAVAVGLDDGPELRAAENPHEPSRALRRSAPRSIVISLRAMALRKRRALQAVAAERAS